MDEKGSKQKKLEMQAKEYKNQLKDLIKEKEENHRKQLLKLYADRDALNLEKEIYQNSRNMMVVDSNREFSKILEEMKQEFEKNKQAINKQYAKAIFHLKEDQKKFQEALRQTEDEYNVHIETTDKKLNDALKMQKKTGEKIRSKKAKLAKDNLKNQERVDNLNNLIAETESQNIQLKNDILHFEKKCKEMEDQLKEQEKIINTKEVKIKDFRNMNFHLQNYKSVYDYQVNTLKEEHEPLSEYNNNLDKHVKTMYHELLTEADSTKALEENIKKLKNFIANLNDQIKNKNVLYRDTKRQFDVLEHDLAYIVETEDGESFRRSLLKKLEEQDRFVSMIEKKLGVANNQTVSSIMENKKTQNLEKLSALELQSIKEELVRQRDMMSKKLVRKTELNIRLEKEREAVFKSIQQEGKMLINKCNNLRKAGLILKYEIDLQEKRAGEIEQRSKQLVAEEAVGGHTAQQEPREKRYTELPLLEYRKNNPLRRAADGEEEAPPPQQNKLLRDLMKEADKLYKQAAENNVNIEEYQVGFDQCRIRCITS